MTVQRPRLAAGLLVLALFAMAGCSRPPAPVPAPSPAPPPATTQPAAPAPGTGTAPAPPCGYTSFPASGTGWALCTGQPGVGSQAKQLYRLDPGAAQWVLVADAPLGKVPEPGALSQGGYASGLAFADGRHGWITHSRGGLLATSDGGRTWAKESP